MKRSTVVLSAAAAIGGLPVAALASSVPDSPNPGQGPTRASLARKGGPQRASRPRQPAAAGTCTLYDNGDADGVNGYSNATVDAFGARRTLLDDFLVPDGSTWTVDAMHSLSVWNALPAGSGTNMEVAIWSDAAGQPGTKLFDMVVTGYSETGSGRSFFSRPEAVSWTVFEPTELEAGRYWFEATIVGPENNFWLTAAQQNEQCWVNYDDLGGLQSGQQVFGVTSDIAWCLDGSADVGPTTAHGLRHLPAGQATLSRDQDGNLTISNIGSSGDDGVSITLGDAAGGWSGDGQILPIQGGLPAGASVALTTRGSIDGTPDQNLGGVTITSDGTTLTLSADLADLAATTYTLNLLNGGVLVDSVTGITGGMAGATSANGQTNIASFLCLLTPAPNVEWRLVLTTAINITTSTGDHVADRIDIIPETPTNVDGMASVELRLADTPDVFVTGETLRMFGADNDALGGAKMKVDTGSLVVSNIGSSGEDGVDMGIPASTGIDLTVVPIGVTSGGDQVILEATGSVAGGAPGLTSLGTTSIANGGLVVATADFGAISASNLVRVQVFNAGVFEGDAVVQGGAGFVALLFSSPTVVGMSSQADPPGDVYFLEAPVLILPRGSAENLEGDELRLLAEEPDAAVDGIEALALRGGGLGSATITAAQITAIPTGACCLSEGCSVLTQADCLGAGGEYQGDGTPCTGETCEVGCVPTADQDGSGCVDFNDILIILQNWGGGGPDGDADCSGFVDFADVLEVLTAWGNGCG